MRIAETEKRLENWGRAARAADPLHIARPGERIDSRTVFDAPVQISPLFEYMVSIWDDEWGDWEKPVDGRVEPIDELDGDVIDVLLGSSKVSRVHRQIIKEWYWKLRKRRITQDDHDGAVRALADILYPLVEMRRAA